MRLAAALTAGAALTAAAPAAAQEHGGPGPEGARTEVTLQYAAFSPPAVDVLAGDTVAWANGSVRRHDVTADDGAWASGDVFPGGGYARAFEAAGTVAYHCTIHPFMRGAVGVHELLLDAPREPGAPGRPFTLRGRSALESGTPIAIEADPGTGFAPVARAIAGDDGGFAATLLPRTSGALRAVAGTAASPAVQLLVLDRSVTATARTRTGRSIVRARVSPASPGATVVLQLRLRERFGWWPVRRARLDADSGARFRVRPPRRVRARVVLTLADGATPLAIGPTLHVGTRRHSARRHRPRH